ncbi:MAG TPA: prepilin peptidase [Allosphingosinicella sp.]|uniref:A24 family peptidase n=1 Tax=Allosphingosinicella sp. TaxID=2823234 RepID=UPI002ED91E49
MNASILPLYAFCALLFLGALQDVFTLRISNFVSAGTFLAALLFVLLNMSVGDWWQHILSFVLTLAVGTWLFTRGLLGGGDVKLLAAAALWFDLWQLLTFILGVALVGAGVTMAAVTIRLLATATEETSLRALRRTSVPYGVAIAAAAIWLAATSYASPTAIPTIEAEVRSD